MDDAPVCPVTGEPMVRDTRPFVVSYKGRRHDVALPGWYCDTSGESIHSREDLKVSDRALMTLKAEVDGLATPSEVARVRKKLGLSQVKASEVLGGGPRSFQKYESGEVTPSRAMTNLLRVMERHPEEIRRLEANMPADSGSSSSRD
ncbi:type II toxin-antitoxin system MqsA family antitoxin [Methylobacterium sp. SyP6R]|uniref:type II toxin-antitoxin system MqsA family antitoxin n=1 Tax=Methylobacterium sp. SyP6R TaxID=2718876 RepID=UPI001F205B37|nr:type II toxin-antitoxin system MqsA family antitoxin [Methylobacterium sp. SyP6R]MCF4123970.1 type II toxin-antitoxin system MqsA family antitoxin [Methylobacterium sp. SyP6R]